MSNLSPLNSPELDQLERRLKAVALPPTARRRERLLYACGRAAGRREIGRRLHAVSAVAVLLTCITAGLSFRLLTGTSRETTVPSPMVEREFTDARIREPVREPQETNRAQRWQLSAGASFEQLLVADELRKAEPLHRDLPDSSPHPALTVASRWWPAELWD